MEIAAKALAKRIEVVLPKLVNADQTGFIKGRYIGKNRRLISDNELHKRREFTGHFDFIRLQKSFRHPRMAIYEEGTRDIELWGGSQTMDWNFLHQYWNGSFK